MVNILRSALTASAVNRPQLFIGLSAIKFNSSSRDLVLTNIIRATECKFVSQLHPDVFDYNFPPFVSWRVWSSCRTLWGLNEACCSELLPLQRSDFAGLVDFEFMINDSCAWIALILLTSSTRVLFLKRQLRMKCGWLSFLDTTRREKQTCY